MEHWEELTPGGLRMVWDDSLFRPGTDAFLLSSLPRLKPGVRVCDLGCGTGVVGLLLLQREPRLLVTGIELQEPAAELAVQCAAANNLTDRFRIHCMDFRRVPEKFPAGGFDLVVMNPPYYAAGSGRESENHARRTARSEGDCPLESWIETAAYLLRTGGALCLVQKPERLADALCALRGAGCEGKRLRFVCKRPASPPSLFLLEGRRGGKPGLFIETPLFLQRGDGTPSEEIERIYFRAP